MDSSIDRAKAAALAVLLAQVCAFAPKEGWWIAHHVVQTNRNEIVLGIVEMTEALSHNHFSER